jgi:hypothetical protein
VPLAAVRSARCSQSAHPAKARVKAKLKEGIKAKFKVRVEKTKATTTAIAAAAAAAAAKAKALSRVVLSTEYCPLRRKLVQIQRSNKRI